MEGVLTGLATLWSDQVQGDSKPPPSFHIGMTAPLFGDRSRGALPAHLKFSDWSFILPFIRMGLLGLQFEVY